MCLINGKKVKWGLGPVGIIKMNALKTDLYQLTMLGAYYVKGLHKKKVSCEAFVRKLPPERRFLVMAGTDEIRDFLSNLRFSSDDIKYLKEVEGLRPVFSTSNFAKYLEDFSFGGDFWAMAEGEIAFAGEPLIRVSGTLPEVHMAETFALSVLNHDIKVASKAARIILAARGRPVLEFGTRRTHHEAAVRAARASYLAGFTATSNVEAGRKYGIPVAGTMSHMWVMVSKNEIQAFKDFKDVYRNPILLIDTFDTLQGAVYATDVPLLSGVRLDSGNLELLSKEVRKILDQKGKQSVKIIVSNDLNEYTIDSLAACGAPIDTFAVGTELVVSRDVPSLGAVYKVVYDDTENRPLMKLSSGKITLPGRKQVFLDQRNGEWKHLVAIEGVVESEENLTPLLDCNIKDGEIVEESVVDLEVSRKYCNAALINLHSNLVSLEPKEIQVPVYPDKSVEELFKKAMENGFNLG